MLPEEGASKPPNIFSKVVFPHPDFPMIDTDSFSVICNEMSLITSIFFSFHSSAIFNIITFLQTIYV